MRRRHQRNPLLMRIIGISILLHLIALPVLAHYGAFKKIQREFSTPIQTELIKLPPPEKEKTEVKRPQPHHIAHHAAAHKSPAPTSHPRQMASQPHLSQPKVIASAGGLGGGNDNGPTVDANGTGKAGQLPQALGGGGPKNATAPAAPPPVQPQPKATQPTPPVTPPPAETKPAPPITKPALPASKAPVFTEAEPLPNHSPQPTIPDDLRGDALDKSCTAEFTVEPDGTPSDVKIVQSTGYDELDRIALDTARQWRFKPATRDGQPVQSQVRLHIEFQVS
ncbi:MAG TPA: energy transducer TonB [Chthonomonadaceae bacterium]|nr:energy transducer TonB [Chthonomonadaceae bacterium]